MRRPAPAPGRRSGLLPRIFATHLFVIAVTTLTAAAVGWTFAPLLLERHVESMMPAARQAPGFARMAADLAGAYREALGQTLIWSVAIATLAAGGVAWALARRLIAPLRALQEAASDLAEGRASGELNVAAPGEIGSLARSFEALQRSLAAAEAERERLLSDLSHELRTPLSNLRGYVEGLEDGVFESNPETQAALHRQLDRLERLVHDLRSVQHLEVEPMSLAPAPFDLLGLIRSSLTTFGPRFAAAEIAAEIVASDAEVLVYGDALRTVQVLENLLGNALRHTPRAGRVEVSLEQAAGEALLCVSDSGPGVAQGEREAVFRRLYQIDPARSASGGGSGLGLTIAKALVERQGGRIGVGESPLGGAAFWFTLPLAGERGRGSNAG